MRKITNKKTASRIIILIFALIGILSVFPFRIWTHVLETSNGGTIVSESEHINYEYSLRQKFVTRYDRLSSIDVYVTKMEKGRYLGAVVYDENGAGIFKTYVDTEGIELPGYVRIPMELNVEPLKDHYLGLEGCRSKYYVALENIPEDSSYVGSLSRKWTEIEGLHLAAKYNYRLPISRQKSLMIIGIIAAAAALIYVAIGLYYRLRPERNTLITVGKAVKYSANPVAAAFFGALMIMVYPLKVFDFRPADIIFYEIGLLISAFLVFYAINHKSVKHEVGISFWDALAVQNRLQYVLIMFSLAMAIWYGCRYMNDLYDIYHSMSERLMVIWLLIAIVLTFSLGEALNAYNLIWLIGACSYGYRYYNIKKLPISEKEYDLHNAVTKYEVIIAILAGLIILNLLRLLIIRIKELGVRSAHAEKKTRMVPSLFGIILYVFFAVIVVLRNTRWWGVALAVTFTVFFIRMAVWEHKKDYYKILSGGLMMNFAISMGFSLLHRYFAGYIIGRFGFIFHTVTVTAEYFTFMGAAATVMLVTKLVALPKKTTLKEIFVSAWKEMTLFGFIMAYAIFTVSRTAYLAIITSMLAVILVVIAYNRERFLRIAGIFVLSVIVCFPAAFTLQRTIPALVGDPVIYVIDDNDEFVRGGASPGSTNFMCVERFVNLFAEKILDMETGTYEYPIDYYNYDINGTGDPYYDNYGNPFEGSDEEKQKYGLIDFDQPEMLLASNVFTRAEFIMLMSEMPDYVDESSRLDMISNGRITIFKCYLKELNMWGHDEMGVELPNGEISVHAHNTYLQVAFDHGIFAGILFMLIIISAMAAGVLQYKKYRGEEPLTLMTFAITVGFAVAGISEWVFQFSNPMTLALMMALSPLVFKAKEN